MIYGVSDITEQKGMKPSIHPRTDQRRRPDNNGLQLALSETHT